MSLCPPQSHTDCHGIQAGSLPLENGDWTHEPWHGIIFCFVFQTEHIWGSKRLTFVIGTVFCTLRTEVVQNVPVWDTTSVRPHVIIREPRNGSSWDLVLKSSFRVRHIIWLISDNFCSHRQRSSKIRVFTAVDKGNCHCIARGDALGWGTGPEAGRTRVRFPRVLLGERKRIGALGWGTAAETGRSRVRFPMVSKEHTFDSFLFSKRLSNKRRAL